MCWMVLPSFLFCLVRDMEAAKASEDTTPQQPKPELPTAEQLKKSRRKGEVKKKTYLQEFLMVSSRV